MLAQEMNREIKENIARTVAEGVQVVAWLVICSSPKDIARAMITLGVGQLVSAIALTYARNVQTAKDVIMAVKVALERAQGHKTDESRWPAKKELLWNQNAWGLVKAEKAAAAKVAREQAARAGQERDTAADVAARARAEAEITAQTQAAEKLEAEARDAAEKEEEVKDAVEKEEKAAEAARASGTVTESTPLTGNAAATFEQRARISTGIRYSALFQALFPLFSGLALLVATGFKNPSNYRDFNVTGLVFGMMGYASGATLIALQGRYNKNENPGPFYLPLLANIAAFFGCISEIRKHDIGQLSYGEALTVELLTALLFLMSGTFYYGRQLVHDPSEQLTGSASSAGLFVPAGSVAAAAAPAAAAASTTAPGQRVVYV